MSKRRSPEQWRSIMSAFECSSQTQSAFCSERGLTISSFQYQLRRHRSNKGNTKPEPSLATGLLEITPLSDRNCLSITSAANQPGRSIRVELSLESRAFTVDCRPDQFAELIDQFSTFHDLRGAKR
jgi:hypothetical protein